MQIFNYLIKLREIFILALCILTSVLLLVINDDDPKSPFRSVAYKSIGKIGGMIQGTSSYFNLTNKVKQLNKENAELSLRTTQLQEALLENIRLKKMLDFKEKTEHWLIPSEVIGQNPLSILNGFLLNSGLDQGIEKSDAVITADGLVGKIVETGNDFSVCQILLDRSSKISAKVQRNREVGIIAWDGGAQLKLMYIAKTIKILIGDIILTSGYSQIFPENLKIGIVINVSLDTDDFFQKITVQPSVNFNQTEEVFIVKGGNTVKPGDRQDTQLNKGN